MFPILSKCNNLVKKRSKEECYKRTWKTWYLPVEVGCRGFIGYSMLKAAGLICIKGLNRRLLVTIMSKKAELASQLFWRKRGEAWKKPL